MTTLVCPLCRIALTPPDHLCPRDGREGVEHAFMPVPRALEERFRVVMPFAGSASSSMYVVDALDSGKRGLLKLRTPPQKARDQEHLRARRELDKQRAVECPYLLVPWENGETEGVPWLFRRWLDGVSLRVRLTRDGAPTHREALGIAAQIAVALEALHTQGLLHRDLHPGHIFLEARAGMPPRVQVIDAGLPFVRQRTDGPPQVGTPGYSAPEQLLGKLVSMRSDLYSVGVVLAEILQAQKLFEGDTADALLAAQLHAGRPTLSDTLAESIRGMVDALLSIDPQRRPFSAQKLRRTLDAYLLEGAPMTRQPTSSFSTTGANGAPTSPSTSSPATPDRALASTEPGLPPAAPKQPSLPGRASAAAPPPPPAAALLSTRPPMPPTGRPSSRAPLPPPPTRKPAPDYTQQLDDALLEELAPPAPKALPPALPARHQPPARPQRANEDYTVPVRLDQILAVSQTPRASAIPPPSPAPHAPDAPVPDAPHGAAQAHVGTLFDPASMTEAARAASAGLAPTISSPSSTMSSPSSTMSSPSQLGAPRHERYEVLPSRPPAPAAAQPVQPARSPAPAAAQPAAPAAAQPAAPAAVQPAAPAAVQPVEPAASFALELPAPIALPAAGKLATPKVEAPVEDFSPFPAHKPTSLGMPNPLALAAAQMAAQAAAPAAAPVAEQAAVAFESHAADATPAGPAAKLDLSHDVTTVMPPRTASQPPESDAPSVGAAVQTYSFEDAANAVADTVADTAPAYNADAGALPPDEITQPVRELQSSLRPPTDDEQRRKLMMYAAAVAAALLLGFGGRAMFGGASDDTVASTGNQDELAGANGENPSNHEPGAAAPAHVEAVREMPKLADLDGPSEPAARVPAVEALPQPASNAMVARAPEPLPVVSAPTPTVSALPIVAPTAAPASAPAKELSAATRSKETRSDEPRRAEKPQRAEKPARGEKTENNAAKWAQARDEARAFYAQREYQKAADAYERATRFDPQNPGTYAGLGAARLQLNNPRGAVDAYAKAVQLSPNTAGFHAALGRAYAAAGDPTRAKASYKRAIALDPENQSIAAALKALE